MSVNIYKVEEKELVSVCAGGSGTIEEKIVSNVACGALPAGGVLDENMSITEAFKKLLIKYNNPTCTIKSSVTKYKSWETPTSNITLTLTYTKGTSDIESVTLSTDASAGTIWDNVAYADAPKTLSTTNETWKKPTTTYTVVVTDTEGKTGKATCIVSFITPFYWGCSTKTEIASFDDLAGLTEVVEAKGTKSYTFTPNKEYLYFVCATAHGEMGSIKDNMGNDYLAAKTFTKVGTVTKDSISLDVYRTDNVQTLADGIKLTFAFKS